MFAERIHYTGRRGGISRSEPIGVGIIGTGGIVRTHIRAPLTHSAGLTRIVAVSDIGEERGRSAAEAGKHEHVENTPAPTPRPSLRSSSRPAICIGGVQVPSQALGIASIDCPTN